MIMAHSEEATVNLPESILKLGPRIEADGAPNDKGYVYCIAEYDENGMNTGYFKIGTAYDPDKRLKDLQTGNVRQLKIWGDPWLVSKRRDAEKATHKALEKYAVYQGGGTEWFKVNLSEKEEFYGLFCEAIEQHLA